MGSQSTGYTLITWNVRGMGSPTKRHKVLMMLKRRGVHIAFLQETHIGKGEALKLQKRWRGRIFATEYSAFARGALIWVRAGVPLEVGKAHIDPEGRHVILEVKLNGKDLLLGCIYAPNTGQIQYLAELSAALSLTNASPLVIGGDFNMVADTNLDRSIPPLLGASIHRTAEGFRTWLSNWGLEDVWRVQHPAEREYSYYSGMHKLHVRLDTFMCVAEMARYFKQAEYLSKTVSDHNPLIVKLQIGETRPAVPLWRLQKESLEDPVFREDLRGRIRDYMRENWNTTENRATEWEALKVVVRGYCIGGTVQIKRMLDKELVEIEDKMRVEELKQGETGLSDELTDLKTQYNQVLERVRCHNYKQYISKAHEMEGRASKLLAGLANPEQRGIPLLKIQNAGGTTVSTQEEINEVFRDYYSKLYDKRNVPHQTEILEYLRAIPLKEITTEVAKELGGPVSPQEIRWAISAMAGGKTPGPDGLISEFYVVYVEELTPLLTEIYNLAWEQKVLPKSLREAVIVPLPKSSVPGAVPGAYRPLSMLNVDFKILSKILANRLAPHMRDLIHEDQCGFIPGRDTSLNLRRLYSVLLREEGGDRAEAGLLAVDLEKAFDSVEWGYLRMVLQEMGFGKSWIRWVTLLYTEPTARVRTNRTVSCEYGVHRGTRQGCPLSPLLFAIAIEPLAIKYRSENVGKGMRMGGEEHLISLYADDLLIYLNEIADAGGVIQTLQEFGGVSGLKVNLAKTCVFPIQSREEEPQTLPEGIEWAPTTFKYLGVQVYRTVEDLREGNMGKAMRALKGSVGFWKTLKLPVMARITLVKMIVLPRLLYYFANLPILIPRKWFSQIDTLLREMIWCGGRNRASLETLKNPIACGGLSLPDLESYYLAAQLQWVAKWIGGKNLREARWGGVERTSYDMVRLMVKGRQRERVQDNILVDVAFQCWRRVQRLTKSRAMYAPAIPLADIPRVRGGGRFTQLELRDWTECGIVTVGDCYNDKTRMPLETLMEQFGLPAGQFLTYAAINATLDDLWGVSVVEPAEHEVMQVLMTWGKGRHLVQGIYKALNGMIRAPLRRTRDKWEQLLGKEVNDIEWGKILAYARKVSRNSRLKYIQFNLLHQAYFTPDKITKIYGGEVRKCPRCNATGADFGHMLWSCPATQLFWKEVIAQLRDTTLRDLQCTMEVCLLGRFQRPKKQKVGSRFVDLGLALARRRITLKWKDRIGPTIEGWLRDVELWAQAEERAIRKEEARGIRQTPIAEDWAEMVAEFCKDKDEAEAEGEGELPGSEVG